MGGTVTTADHIAIRPDCLGGFDIYDGPRRIGTIWPDPNHEGQWWARFVMPPAERCDSRLDAIALLAGVPTDQIGHLWAEADR